MAVYITDPWLEERLRNERAESGSDRFDEVWEGVLFMPPMPNNEHQDLVGDLVAIFKLLIAWPKLGKVYGGVNVSEREEDWTFDYRVPDVAVFLSGTLAKNSGNHWRGGPDFLIEVASPGDRSKEKLAFYAHLGVREMLWIGRDPWELELYRRRGAALVLAGRSTIKRPILLESKVVPVSFRLVPDGERPAIEVAHKESDQRWAV